MRFDRLLWVTTIPCRAWIGFLSNKHNPSEKSGLDACISSRITTVIHVVSDHQINYNCFNEPFAVSPYKSLYLDMHGLIFETSIWLLAGSTRLLFSQLSKPWTISSMVNFTGLANRSYQIRIFPTLPEGKHGKTVHWFVTANIIQWFYPMIKSR